VRGEIGGSATGPARRGDTSLQTLQRNFQRRMLEAMSSTSPERRHKEIIKIT
jgi:hypothetical protein